MMGLIGHRALFVVVGTKIAGAKTASYASAPRPRAVPLESRTIALSPLAPPRPMLSISATNPGEAESSRRLGHSPPRR